MSAPIQPGPAPHNAASPLQRLELLLLGLAVVLLPFNDLPYLHGALGELGAEGAVYAIVPAAALLALDLGSGSRLTVRLHWTALALWAFVAWTLVSAVVNLPEIASLQTKGRTGAVKLLLQVVMLAFVTGSAFAIHRILARLDAPLRWFRHWLLLSVVVAGGYSLFELAVYLGRPMPGPIATFTGLIHGGDESLEYFGRIRSVSGEASWFAMYCSLAFPWLLSFFFTMRRRAWLVLPGVGYLLVLVVLSWSRTAYVITTVQLGATLALALLAGRRTVPMRRLLLLGTGVAGAAAAAATFFVSSSDGRGITRIFASLLDPNNLSNVGRAGAQAAAFGMARQSPMFGVGIGEYGFHMPAFVPLWARTSEEIQLWMSGAPNSPWAPAQSLYARLAAETGYVGLTLWLVLWIGVTAACARRFLRDARAGRADPMALALVVSLIGAVLSAVNADSLRFYIYWLTLPLAWIYLGRTALDPAGAEPVSLAPEIPS